MTTSPLHAVTGAGVFALATALVAVNIEPAFADPPAPELVVSSFTDTHEVIHGNPLTGTAFDINTKAVFTADPAVDDFLAGVVDIPADADIVRVHISWSDFEQTPDTYTWTRIDDFLDRVAAQGKQAEVQLLMSESPSPSETGTFPYVYPPAWLFDVKNVPYRDAPYGDGTYTTRQPIYYDQGYLTELGDAVSAFADRYDGHAGIAWVDLRAFALFGEWSGWNDASNFPWPDSATRTATLRAIIDIYRTAFTETMVTMQNAGASVDASDPDADTQAKRFAAFAYDYGAEEQNWGFRSDTVNALGYWMDYSTWGQSSWNNRKLRRSHIQASEGAGWSNPLYMLNDPRRVVMNALEDYRTNLQGINNTSFAQWDDMKDAYGEWFTTLGRYSGYRLLLEEAAWSSQVAPGGEFRFAQTWTNTGFGFSPRDYPLEVSFVDPSTGAVAWSGTDEDFTLRRLFKGDYDDRVSAFTLPSGIAEGEYEIRVALVEDGEPRILLPMPGGQDRRYPVGTITVAAGVTPVAVESERAQFIVQAEDYTDVNGAYGVYDALEGGHDEVYYEHAGQWTEYDNVYVPETGDYRVEFRVSTEAGNRFSLQVDGQTVVSDAVTPASGGYRQYTTVERTIHLEQGEHTLRFIRGDVDRWFFANWFRFTLDQPQSQRIQAESADDAWDVWLAATETIDDDGTPSVSWIETGDYLEYRDIDIPRAGDYLLEIRYSAHSGVPDRGFRLLADGVDVSGELLLPSTGAIETMKTVDFVVPLDAGVQDLRIEWTRANVDVLFNWFALTEQRAHLERIEGEHYSFQWNLDKLQVWEGHDTAAEVVTAQGPDAVDAARFRNERDFLRFDSVFVPHRGWYDVRLRVASPGVAQTVVVEVDGQSIPLAVPATPGNGAFVTVDARVKLRGGVTDIRLVAGSQPPAGSPGIAVDWVEVEAAP